MRAEQVIKVVGKQQQQEVKVSVTREQGELIKWNGKRREDKHQLKMCEQVL